MRRRWLALLLCLQVCAGAGGNVSRVALAQQKTTADVTVNALRVDERATRVAFDEGRSRVSLAVENAAGRALDARVSLELLDTADRVVARDERAATLRAGRGEVVSSLPVSHASLPGREQSSFLWYRLRYRVAPDEQQAGAHPAHAARVAAASGVVSLSEVTPDLFELRVAAPEKVREGQPLRVRARAVHPVSGRPVGGVAVTGEAKYYDVDDNEQKLTAAAVTGADGNATLDFKPLPKLDDDAHDVDLEVTARRGDFAQTASAELELDHSLQFLITTDKPLYQPGQTLHARSLVLDSARRAVAGLDAVLEIEDEAGETVFRAPLKTSRFGVASVDWPIPEGARLGNYDVRVEVEDGKYDDEEGAARVRVSRYELPNFSVAARPDRPYYLPGQSALVEVRADYLFGQPVKRARVRVVRETEREWNYREQKYDVKEGAKHEGEFGDDGVFRVRLSLADEFGELAQNSWSRFTDATYAAYVTDPTTNRTEQRRFTLRVSRDPVHLYVTEGGYTQAAGLPLALYVSAYYPDGTPAECEVNISEAEPAVQTRLDGGNFAPLRRTVRTNRYGVAKVTGPVVRRTEPRRHYLRLRFEARDREGRGGRLEEEFWMRADAPVIRVETDKVIYAAGEPIAAEIASDEPGLRLIVEAVAEGRALHSERVRLDGRGRARLTVPYRPGFENRVRLFAYAADIPESNYDSYASGARTVIYPRDRELKLDLRFERATYEPGEEAGATARVRTGAGRTAEAALGVVVFDKAVEERARTDAEFSSSYGFSSHFYSFWYGPESIGGVSLRDLEKLDPTRARPAGFDTVAELLLQRDRDYYSPNFFGGAGYSADQRSIFANLAAAQLRPAVSTLDALYERTRQHPTDEAALRRVLSEAGIAFDSLRDPWGTPYRAEFSVEREVDVLSFRSAGADKKIGSEDDWHVVAARRPYFRPVGDLMARTAEDHRRRAGAHLTSPEELKRELLGAHRLDFDKLRDRFGRAYALRFAVSGPHYVFRVTSAGPDGRLDPEPRPYGSDDFDVWSFSTDYFAETRALADAALAAFHKSRGWLPKDDAQLRAVLHAAGLGDGQLRDHWGRAYYAAFRAEARYGDRVEGVHTGDAQRVGVTPVTRKIDHVALRSAGPDGVAGTADDFSVADFSAVASEQSAADRAPQAVAAVTTFSGATGAITGTITDPQGAVVAGATVTATHQQQADLVYTAETDEDGKYVLRNLRSGLYMLRAQAAGFKDTLVADVPVRASALAQFDLRLDIGGVTETVEVTGAGGGARLETLSMSVGVARRGATGKAPAAGARPPVQTPRLRKDFPETLYWQPELLTDRGGRAQLKFKLADNITTWKVSAIASTETGELGTVEREIRAFRPFFVEHDPPRVLTEGDEISLPVVLRNYLERPQRVAVSLKTEDWFTLLGPAEKSADVAAGDASRETFDLRATASVKEGKQRVTALASDSSDAVERNVHVHPDGEEIAHTETRLLGGGAGALEAVVPAEAVPRSARAELKVYPNLMAHAFESVEAIMSRPNGCGEQTISSAYPSLLVLRHHARAGGDSPQRAALVAKARGYLRVGYERLLSYRTADGGFAYWTDGAADVALTAYALRFLRDAAEFVEVDEGVRAGARRWLASRQRPDGSWPAPEWVEKSDTRRAALLTAYVARVLAEHSPATQTAAPQQQPPPATAPTSQPGQPRPTVEQLHSQTPTAPPPAASNANAQGVAEPTTLARALKYLAARAAEVDEPYLIASYLLAAVSSGGVPRAEVERTAARLRSLARDEKGATYWSLETNTPFYGWGLAGRVETTALAVQALARAREQGSGENREAAAPSSAASPVAPPTPAHDEVVSRGLLFLLRNKDRYGVWHSTQATVNVLDALMLLARPRGSAAGDERAEVFVNGRPVGTLALPADARSDAPVALDLTPFVGPGANRVEIRGPKNFSDAAAAQLVTTYYLPWQHSAADGTERGPRSSRQLRLAVSFDRVRAAVGEEIVCRVEAERVGHSGYGMLLAEVGLPPGADVDRATLERAMKEAGWGLQRYDVLPDRLVLYLWPRAGGTRFSFSFRPRLGMRAKAAASQLYDYYNPEARAVLAPPAFVVKDDGRRPAPAARTDAPAAAAPSRR